MRAYRFSVESRNIFEHQTCDIQGRFQPEASASAGESDSERRGEAALCGAAPAPTPVAPTPVAPPARHTRALYKKINKANYRSGDF